MPLTLRRAAFAVVFGIWAASAFARVLAGASFGGTTAQTSQNAVEFFESNVRPVLAESCFGCHTTTATAGLRVDSRDSLLKGGDSGPAIVPGDPDQSLLIKAIRHANDAPKMPRGGAKLTDAKIAALVQW